MKTQITKNHIRSTIYGLVVGDALGVPVEFQSRAGLTANPVTGMKGYGTYNQPVGTWSDDSSMTLATLDAMSRDENDLDEYMKAFLGWYMEGKYTPHGTVFGVGNTTRMALARYQRGMDPLDCGLNEVSSNGNGSLMRISPLIFSSRFYDGSQITEKMVEFVYKISSLTHGHILSKMSCLYYVVMGVEILKHREKRGLTEILSRAISKVDDYYKSRNMEIVIYKPMVRDGLLDSMNVEKERLRSSGYVIHSLEAGTWCLYHTSSYEEAVLTAVNLGEDTDTTAAVTGALAGLYYGRENIPKEWVDSLQNKKIIDRMVDAFYDELGRTR